MARTLGSHSKIKKDQDPEVSYNNLSAVEQLVVYYYWTYLNTGGQQGWDIKKSGSREQWRHYPVIYEHWKTGSGFYNRAKVSSNWCWRCCCCRRCYRCDAVVAAVDDAVVAAVDDAPVANNTPTRNWLFLQRSLLIFPDST